MPSRGTKLSSYFVADIQSMNIKWLTMAMCWKWGEYFYFILFMVLNDLSKRSFWVSTKFFSFIKLIIRSIFFLCGESPLSCTICLKCSKCRFEFLTRYQWSPSFSHSLKSYCSNFCFLTSISWLMSQLDFKI